MEAVCTSNGVPFFAQAVASGGLLLQSRSRVSVSSVKRTPSIALSTRAAAVSDGTKGGLQATAQLQEASPQAIKLKAELFKAIEEAEDQTLDDKCLSIIAALEQLRCVPDVAAHPHLLKGCLVGLKAKFKENRRDGQVRYLGHSGLTTLGATTFNALKPADLQIALYGGSQHVSMDSPDSYVLFVDVGIVDPVTNEPTLLGEIANRARFTIGKSYMLQIEFLSSDIKPKFPEKDLDAWLKIFKEANPDMDESGFVSAPHRQPIKGGTDIIYMDDEIRIHRGHKGGISVLRLLDEPI